MIKIAQVTASMSRQAGGLFHSVSGLAKALGLIDGVESAVISLEDSFSQEDSPQWEELPLHLHASLGPATFGYSHTLLSDLMTLRPDVAHAHGIWMYPTLACRRWGRQTERPYLISPRGMLDSWAVEHSATKKKLAFRIYEKANLHEASCIHTLGES